MTSVAIHRLSGRSDKITWQVIIGILLAVAVAVVAGRYYGQQYWGSDLDVYHQGGASILRGVSPYSFTQANNQPFIYTPFAAVVFVPLAWLPLNVALGVWTLIAMLCLETTIWIVIGHLGGLSLGRRATWTVLGTAAALPLTSVMFELWAGQIELLLMLLIIADLTRRSERFRGYGIGIAAGIKLTPLIFVPYLLLTRRFRAAGQTVVGFVGTVVVGFAVTPRASWSYWHGTFFDMSRMLPDNNEFLNQSLRGLLARLPFTSAHGTGLWLLVVGVVGVAGLAVAVWASRRGEELAGVLACAITGLLVSPLSWVHHWVWCAPVIVLCAHRAWRGRHRLAGVGTGVVWLVCAVSSAWWLLQPSAEFAGFTSVVFTNQFIAVGVVLLGVLAILLWRNPISAAKATVYQLRPRTQQAGDDHVQRKLAR
jgi:alpha-1,2-mannosyltransferase